MRASLNQRGWPVAGRRRTGQGGTAVVEGIGDEKLAKPLDRLTRWSNSRLKDRLDSQLYLEDAHERDHSDPERTQPEPARQAPAAHLRTRDPGRRRSPMPKPRGRTRVRTRLPPEQPRIR